MSTYRSANDYSHKLRTLGRLISQLLSVAVAVTFMFAFAAQRSDATNYDLNVTNQNWTTGTNWSPNGVPVSGDSVIIDLNVTVSSPQSFGNGSVNSTITGGATPAITINPGQTLTHVAGSTLVTNSTPYFGISNTGTFINQGTILNSGPRFLIGYPTPGSTFANQGTFEFTANNAGLELISNGGSFVNQTGGTVRVNLGAATDLARIDGGADITGQYLQSGGNPIDFVKGTLVFSPPGGIGGALNDATFASIFGPINANSALRLSGGLPTIALSGATDLSRVSLADSAYALRAVVGGTTINITNPSGLNFAPGIAQVVIPAGRSITNVAGSKLISSTATNGYTAISESGTFYNQGTFQVENRFIVGYPTGGTTFENQGAFSFTKNGAQLEFLQVNSKFKNQPGGTVTVNLPNATDTARIYSSALDNNGLYQNNGGSAINFVKGTLIFAPWTVSGGTLNDAEFANLFGPIGANSSMQLGGAYNINLTGATDVSRVTLGGIGGFSYRAQLGGTTISATGPNGLNFTHTGFIDIAGGRTITNLAGSTLVNLAGQENYLGGAGTFANQGTLKIGNRFLMGYTAGGTQLNNSGLVSFTNNGGRVELYQNGTAFNNLANGKISVALPNATDLARVFQNSGAVSFSNLGTIEVTKGIFRVDNGVTVPSWTANTLIDGTYRVIANGNNSTLDLVAGGTSAGSFTTIGANAKVILSSTGVNVATFSQLGSITNLQGELYVHGTKTLAVGASPLNVTGTLGGNGTYNPTSSIVFNGGELDPSSLTGGPGTLTINGDLVLSSTTQLSYSLGTPNIVGGGINDLVVVNGNLTLDGVLNITDLPNFGVGTYRLFNYTGSLFNNGLSLAYFNYALDTSTIGQVNLIVLPVPEPSTGLLLLGGVVLYRRRKRNK